MSNKTMLQKPTTQEFVEPAGNCLLKLGRYYALVECDEDEFCVMAGQPPCGYASFEEAMAAVSVLDAGLDAGPVSFGADNRWHSAWPDSNADYGLFADVGIVLADDLSRYWQAIDQQEYADAQEAGGVPMPAV